jgi:hypothetical protein
MLSSDLTLLVCHGQRCDWDWDAPVYVTTNGKTGRVCWQTVQPCKRGCESTKTIKFKPDPDDPQVIGKPAYFRTDEFRNFGGGWFSEALRRRVMLQAQAGGILPPGGEK